jgi:hypothetical protein
MLGAVLFGWTTMMLTFRFPELASFLAGRASSTESAEGKAALRAPIG